MFMVLVFYHFSDSSEIIIHSDDAFAPVGYVNFKEMHLEDKNQINKVNIPVHIFTTITPQ